MSYAYLLKNVSLFAQINDDELEALSSDLLLQNFHKKQVLFQQGSTTSSLYIVKSGSVQVTAFGHNHEVTYTAIYGPDQCFGEFSLLDGLPRSGEAVAITNSDLLVLTRPTFFRYLERYPMVAIKLLVTVSRRMRFAEAAVEHIAPQTAEQKIAAMLVDVAERYGMAGVAGEPWTRLGLRLTGDDLAGLSGVTRDTANMVLNQLRGENMIQVERSHVVAVNPLRLHTISSPPVATVA
jgi:CRP/FNR family transcriptional regulator, cyclic AMP receptor protein